MSILMKPILILAISDAFSEYLTFFSSFQGGFFLAFGGESVSPLGSSRVLSNRIEI